MLTYIFQILLVIFITNPFLNAVRDIGSIKELRETLSQKKPLCIMFYAPWCSACKTMSGPFQAASDQLKKDVTFIKVNADNEKLKESLDFFGIEAVPTIVVKHVGVFDKNKLVQGLQNIFSLSKTEAPKKSPAPAKKAPAKKPAPQKKAPVQKKKK